MASILCDLVKTFNIHVAVYLSRPLGASYSIPKDLQTVYSTLEVSFIALHCLKNWGMGKDSMSLFLHFLRPLSYMAVARGYGK